MPWSKDNLPDAVKGKDWTDTQVSEFVRTANAILRETDDESKAISIAISQVEKRNAAPAFDKIDAEYASNKLGLTFDTEKLLRGMNVEAEHTKDPVTAARIAADHLAEHLDYYEKLAKCVENSASPAGYPKFYYARHMKAGVAGYNNETIMVNDDTIKRMLPTFNGKPVYIEHQDVKLETLKEDAAGFVVDSFWNELDGWAWDKIMITDTDAISLIEGSGWAVSNAYIPTESQGGGTTHNVPYDREITNGEFTHLALVPNPRYEEAKIFTPEQFKNYQEQKRQQLNELKNSNPEKKAGIMLEFFKTKREAVSQVDADTSVELTNAKGEKLVVSVEDMVKAVESAQTVQNAKPTMIKVGDKEMTAEQLTKAYLELQNAKGKKNESDEDEKENESEEDEDMENSEDEDADDMEKKNSKHFDELKNAHKRDAAVQTIDTDANRLARGKANY